MLNSFYTRDGQWVGQQVAWHGHDTARARFGGTRGTTRHARGPCQA